ncbi:hypothetical protein BHE74_00022140 [Ensete ventricosum]|nr:hypothetical protein GW17_00033343 [Ensete ventricosum]RWW70187.1 hypothetical protein BHE74_00022140 [Ensete ventricosum]
MVNFDHHRPLPLGISEAAVRLREKRQRRKKERAFEEEGESGEPRCEDQRRRRLEQRKRQSPSSPRLRLSSLLHRVLRQRS